MYESSAVLVISLHMCYTNSELDSFNFSSFVNKQKVNPECHAELVNFFHSFMIYNRGEKSDLIGGYESQNC